MATNRPFCIRCLKCQLTCYCAELRPFRTNVQIVILQHPLERRKAIGTARMTHLSIEGSLLIQGKEFMTNTRVNTLIADPKNHCIVLYPGKKSQNISLASDDEIRKSFPSDKKILLFIIDGTWTHAQRMLRLSPNLLALHQICFTPKNRSDYRIRQQPAEYCLSTIEAVHQILGHLESSVNADILLKVFRHMVDQQIQITNDHLAKSGKHVNFTGAI